ncbi:hypothetical protein BJ508DRAFT_312583 [Ascobolus immersus RN42]|uniref:Uncharacterized protein n=1 Tax=Ascobolus immersus RN42 TaxID=1160509 RepID=A0A3N4HLN1_ASCIM|nr:hypothetical protein BJ508DRAFT_312583 [Ascobolus immersus RN42]
MYAANYGINNKHEKVDALIQWVTKPLYGEVDLVPEEGAFGRLHHSYEKEKDNTGPRMISARGSSKGLGSVGRVCAEYRCGIRENLTSQLQAVDRTVTLQTTAKISVLRELESRRNNFLGSTSPADQPSPPPQIHRRKRSSHGEVPEEVERFLDSRYEKLPYTETPCTVPVQLVAARSGTRKSKTRRINPMSDEPRPRVSHVNLVPEELDKIPRSRPRYEKERTKADCIVRFKQPPKEVVRERQKGSIE